MLRLTTGRRPPRRSLRALAAALMVGLLAACTTSAPDPGPSRTTDTAARAAADLSAGLAKKNLSALEFVGSSGAQVDRLFQPLVSGMGALSPTVTVGSVTVQASSATAVLSYAWTFPGLAPKWTYETQAQLVDDGGRWKASWQPNVLLTQLDGSNRLTQKRLDPDRGELLGADGDAIVRERPVVRIGLDKSQVSVDQAASSAARLAKLVKVDPKAYAKRVTAAGQGAFVEAIVFRASAADRPANKTVFAIPGALPIEGDQMLAPNRDFASAIIGSVGEATQETVQDSGGAVVAGDQVGLSGLQKRYDTRLRGTPGVQVQLVAAKTSGSSSPSSSTPGPSSTPSTSTTTKPVSLFDVKPVPGQPLSTTLNIALQQLAESTLAKTKPAAALVAIRPSTGAILAAANSPGANGQSVATTGELPPGSTFKVVSALALLRAGLKPSSPVTCPASVTVQGMKFTNYSDYPDGYHGRIDLETALAQSCNTAFIGQRGRLKESDLGSAAASLGVGTDYDVGFPSFFGSVPSDDGATGRAAAMIGQGKIQASPMAMASVVASVSAGKTVVPHLIEGQKPTAKGKPLTAGEARQLREMMRAVVTQGSGRVLRGVEPPAVIAKTGTAEYGPRSDLKTHAWMIAGQGDLAVAVFVNDGDSGSGTAGPLLKAFLSKAS